MKVISWLALLFVIGVFAGCSSTPSTRDFDSGSNPALQARADEGAAARAAEHARNMVGKPYVYGGNSPSGFDCSGLVHYSYQRVGVSVPRTTRSQLNASLPVTARALRAGDLVFFDQEGRKYSHVGIYIGDGRFVHAPSSGKRVRIDRLDKQYWQQHFVAARRI
jgi:cell wall-associated NlpC family hydrolase